MDIDLPPGTYVVAVSGGVDSMALLHALAERYQNDSAVKCIVAHFDHGIRHDSTEDTRLVRTVAREYGLPFVYHQGKLGVGANEAEARRARYKFLHHVRRVSGAKAVLTAHHQDDLVETTILNLVRGTKGRGLHALRSRDTLVRPLLHIPKKKLVAYAREQGIIWREDSTNQNQAILRNYVRAQYVSDINKTRRGQLLKRIKRSAEIHDEIEQILGNYFHMQPHTHSLERESYVALPHEVAREVMVQWLRARAAGVEPSRRLIERLVIAAKAGRNGSKVDVANGYKLELSSELITLTNSTPTL